MLRKNIIFFMVLGFEEKLFLKIEQLLGTGGS
jgi:hypothetical protein